MLAFRATGAYFDENRNVLTKARAKAGIGRIYHGYYVDRRGNRLAPW